MQDALPPEVDTELVRQLGQQGLSQLERRHDDLEVLRAEHGCHPGGEEGRVEDLLRGHDHPEHGLQSGVPHTRARAGRLDLDEDGEQDPGELGRQLPSGLLLVPRLAIHGVTGGLAQLVGEEPLHVLCGAALLPDIMPADQVHREPLVARPGADQEGVLKHPAVVVAIGVPLAKVVQPLTDHVVLDDNAGAAEERVHSEYPVTGEAGKQL